MRRRRRIMTGCIAGALLLLLAAGPSPAAGKAEIRRVQWGFDGKVVPERVNLLSIQIVNPGANPYEGAVALQRTTEAGEKLGACYMEPCYVSPFSSRWVQLYPYVIGEQ